MPLLNVKDESIETRHNHVGEPNAPVLNDEDKSIETVVGEVDESIGIARDGVIKPAMKERKKTSFQNTSKMVIGVCKRMGTRPTLITVVRYNRDIQIHHTE